ncbi:MAG: lipopolysaccharide heptosyltransferase II [Candidatus Xiphinematobacter sp.]|nr:MAG: lipopolysaccharide heptosyltransferase II [Candidatus Xiphinematobacter sp.]
MSSPGLHSRLQFLEQGMHHVFACVAYGVIGIIRLLPLSICFFIGQILGLAAWGTLPRYRKLAKKNIIHAFPKKYSNFQVNRLVLQHFITAGANCLSALKIPTLSEPQIHACSSVENKELIQSCVEAGRGVVAAVSHMGNWELFAQLNSFFPNVPTGAVYQPLRSRWVDNLVNKGRCKRGLVLFNRKNGFSAPITMLRQGGVVGVLVDQHAGDGGIWTPLFYRLASTSPLAATLACRTGAAVLPMAIFTDGFARWRISIRHPISYQPGCSNKLTADINCVLELQIQESPKDWFWVHDRWKIPNPDFLLFQKRRGTYLPKGTREHLFPFRILVRSSNWLGDAVMSIPAVQALKKGRADARISVLVAGELAALWHTIKEVDEVIPISKGESLWSIAHKLRGRFEAAILFPNSCRCALEVFLAGIPRRVGYRGHYRFWLLNQIVEAPKQGAGVAPKHHSEHYLWMAKALGAPPPQLSSPISLPLVPSSRLIAPTLGLCPGAAYGPAKHWPMDRFQEVIRGVSEETGYRWKVFGTSKDASIVRAIVAGLPKDIVLNYVGKTDLTVLISELLSIRLLLTNDTGVMHLAALLGIPVVAIFGSTEPLLTAPLGRKHSVLRQHVECSPCFLQSCPIDFRCMKAISVRQVKEAVFKVLEYPNGARSDLRHSTTVPS